MYVKQYVSYNGNKFYISYDLKYIMAINPAIGNKLEDILTYGNVLSITELNQFIDSIIDSIDVFGNNSDYRLPNVFSILNKVCDILKSEKLAQGLIPKDFASKFMKKIIAIYQEKDFKDFDEFKRMYDEKIDILLYYLWIDKISVSNDDYDKIIKSLDLDSEKDTLMPIVKLIINKIRSFDEETKGEMILLVEQIYEKEKDKTFAWNFVELLFNENFINGKIKKEHLIKLIEFLDLKCYSEYGNNFFEILSSENFGRGIIGSENLSQFISLCKKRNTFNMVRADILTKLLSSEYYGLGLITKEHLDLIVSDEYVALIGVIDYFVNSNNELSLEDRYNWILGILNFENKQELCKELTKLVKANFEKTMHIGALYAQFIMMPDFDIRPTDAKVKKKFCEKKVE